MYLPYPAKGSLRRTKTAPVYINTVLNKKYIGEVKKVLMGIDIYLFIHVDIEIKAAVIQAVNESLCLLR